MTIIWVYTGHTLSLEWDFKVCREDNKWQEFHTVGCLLGWGTNRVSILKEGEKERVPGDALGGAYGTLGEAGQKEGNCSREWRNVFPVIHQI